MNIPKFRAYDKVSGEVFEVVSIDFERDYVVLKSKYGAFCACLDEVEIMQSTGLKDRSGAEIFEGDIVESRASQNKEDWKRWKVYFEDGSFVFEHKWIIRKKEYSMKEFLCEDEIEFYHLEVIGNIYENPELLEGVEQ